MRRGHYQFILLIGAGLFTLGLGEAGAVDGITGASRPIQGVPNPNAQLWITGLGFVPGSTVSISGDGIMETEPPTVILEGDRNDSGRGDGIVYLFSIAADAMPGTRNVTVISPDGRTVTSENAIELVPDMNAMMPVPMPPSTVVDRVSRASPAYVTRGEQVNLWVVGETFTPGVMLTFGNPGLGPALLNGEPIPQEVFPNAASEAGNLDGIQYFMRVAPDAPLGISDITVTGTDGSTATGRQLIEVLRSGARPPAGGNGGPVDAVTGASPRAAYLGRNVSLWIWGEGFEPNATVTFSNPKIQNYTPPEVVEVSQSHPGYSGIRNFLIVAQDAPLGPVDITVTNPGGAPRTASGLFEIVDGDGQVGGSGAVSDQGDCPDDRTSVAALTRVTPDTLPIGRKVRLAIEGQAFACGAQVRIDCCGIKAHDQPRLVRDAANPFNTTLYWTVEAEQSAELGARSLTVINPNNTSKNLENAIQVTPQPQVVLEGGCDQVSAPSQMEWLWLVLFGVSFGRRRRVRSWNESEEP